MNESLRKAHRVRENLTKEFGRPVTKPEMSRALADQFGWPPEKVEGVLSVPPDATSLNGPVSKTGHPREPDGDRRSYSRHLFRGERRRRWCWRCWRARTPKVSWSGSCHA